MTISQYRAMIHFHRKAYKAYAQCGQLENARMARMAMINLYLEYRDVRSK